jgi:outer membrane receptor for ferrienterochelin and colicins
MRHVHVFSCLALVAVTLHPAVAAAQGQPASGGAPAAPPPAAPAPADDELTAMLNEQVVSGASRVTESIETAPVTASTVRAADLRKYGIRTLAEALRFLSVGVFTFDGSNAVNNVTGARGVAINGDTNRHFLFVVDGSVASSDLGTTTGWSFGMPLEMIDTIEVILGPGSVLYGGNAMLGVINIKTKAARHMEGVHVFAEYGVSPSADASGHFSSFAPSGDGTSPRLAASLGHTFRLLGEDAEVTSEVEWAQSTLPSTPIALQTQPVPTVGGAAVAPFGGTLSNQILDGTVGGYARLKVGRLAVDGAINRGYQPLTGVSGGVVFPDTSAAPSPSTASTWTIDNARFDATYSFDLGPRLSGFVRPYVLSSTYASNRAGEVGSTSCPPGGTPGSRCEITNEFVARHQGVEVQGSWDVGGDGRWQVLAGIDGRAEQSGNVNRAQDLATSKFYAPIGSFDATGATMGVYGQLRAQPWSWLGLNAGVRGDAYHDDATGFAQMPTSNPVSNGPLPSMAGSAVSPRGGVVLSPTDTTTLHASAGTAFRPPSTLERYTTTAAVELAGNLQPETVSSAELGITQKFGAQRALFTVFASQWDHMIGLGQGSALGKVQFQDTGTIDNYGLNAAVEGSLGLERFQYGASFTWGYARQQTPAPDLSALPAALVTAVSKAAPYAVNDIELTGAPEMSGNARVSYDFQNGGPVAALAASVYGPALTSFAYTNVLSIAPGTDIPVFGYNWASTTSPKFTDPMVELRATLTGPVPGLQAVRYRLMGSYLFSSAFTPNAYGAQPGGSVPTVANVPGLSSVPGSTGQLFPTAVATVMAGLEATIDP